MADVEDGLDELRHQISRVERALARLEEATRHSRQETEDDNHDDREYATA